MPKAAMIPALSAKVSPARPCCKPGFSGRPLTPPAREIPHAPWEFVLAGGYCGSWPSCVQSAKTSGRQPSGVASQSSALATYR